MKTIVTMRFNRLLTLEESSMLMGAAAELGAKATGFELHSMPDEGPEDARIRRCSNCGKEVGTKKSVSSWFWDIREERMGMPIALCGNCNGTVTSENRRALLKEMRSD